MTDTEFTERMLKFHRKVNPKEGLIGFYKTGSALDDTTLSIYQYYLQLLQDPKNKGLLSQPLLFLIDPTMQSNRLSIKVSFQFKKRRVGQMSDFLCLSPRQIAPIPSLIEKSFGI